MNQRFYDEWLGKWEDSPGYIAALKAWLDYYIRMEEFERTLPGVMGPRHGWVVDYPYVRTVSAFGNAQRERLRNLLASVAEPDEIQRAKEVAAAIDPLEKMKEIFASLNKNSCIGPRGAA